MRGGIYPSHLKAASHSPAWPDYSLLRHSCFWSLSAGPFPGGLTVPRRAAGPDQVGSTSSLCREAAAGWLPWDRKAISCPDSLGHLVNVYILAHMLLYPFLLFLFLTAHFEQLILLTWKATMTMESWNSPLSAFYSGCFENLQVCSLFITFKGSDLWIRTVDTPRSDANTEVLTQGWGFCKHEWTWELSNSRVLSPARQIVLCHWGP